MQEKYTAQNIKVLQGLEAVRKRPGMYIGSTDSRGLHHLIWEIFDNAIDEVYAGNANVISIILNKDNSVSIQDNGRGIPVDINPISNLSGIDTVFTMLHAGGKFDDSNYKAAAGLHGVGSSVVNALSDWLSVKVFRNNTTYESKYINGGNIEQATLDLKIKSNHTGTLVTFHPDNKIFKSIVFNANLIKERIQEASYLFKGLKIIFKDEINNEVVEYMSKDGLSDYIKFINIANSTISPIISLNGLYKEIGVSVAMQYSEESTEVIVSFANSVKTSDGGSHENGFKSALLKTFNNYIDKWKINTNKNHELELSDLTEGLTCIINVTIPEKLITFEGQTKGRLFTIEAKEAVENIVNNQLLVWLENNREEAKKIIDKAYLAKKARLSAKSAREAVKKLNSVKKETSLLAGKLTAAQGKDPTQNELFIVEGESAGGSAKLGRDRLTQAILPLRGKILNVNKANISEVLKSEMITNIIASLGVGIGKNLDMKKLKYWKVIIMTDADTDGSHIQLLLLTLFYRYFIELITNGHIYIALPPLFKLENKKTNEVKYAWNETQLEELKKTMSNLEVQRYKGLGEMNADQLYETTMNKKTRQLIKVNLEDAALAERRLNILMGDKSQLRKDWINENIDFSNETE